MDDLQARSIISALANGHSPITGEQLDEASVVQNADVIRALFVALSAIEGSNRVSRQRKKLPANAGKPWTAEEDRVLLEKFDEGMEPTELAALHERTIAGVVARLERHGRLETSAWRDPKGGPRRPQLAESLSAERRSST